MNEDDLYALRVESREIRRMAERLIRLEAKKPNLDRQREFGVTAELREVQQLAGGVRKLADSLLERFGKVGSV